MWDLLMPNSKAWDGNAVIGKRFGKAGRGWRLLPAKDNKMTTITQNRKAIEFVTWLLAAVVLLVLAGCSPFTANSERTATPSPIYSPTQNPLYKSEKSTPTPAPSCTVTGATVYLRAGAAMRYEPKQILRDGERLEVLHQAGAWLFVLTGKHAGYVHSNYCR